MRHEHMLAWTPEEDRYILELFEREGRKWGKIAGMLNGRSSASVRNRYLRIEKGRQLRAQGQSKNRCAACGQHKLGHVCTVKAFKNKIQPTLAAAATAESMAIMCRDAPADEAVQPMMAMVCNDVPTDEASRPTMAMVCKGALTDEASRPMMAIVCKDVPADDGPPTPTTPATASINLNDAASSDEAGLPTPPLAASVVASIPALVLPQPLASITADDPSLRPAAWPHPALQSSVVA